MRIKKGDTPMIKQQELKAMLDQLTPRRWAEIDWRNIGGKPVAFFNWRRGR